MACITVLISGMSLNPKYNLWGRIHYYYRRLLRQEHQQTTSCVNVDGIKNVLLCQMDIRLLRVTGIK
jgi:hypothetical protein